MAGFPDAFLDDLRARVPVSAVVGRSHKLRKQGQEFVAIDDPSLSCNDSKGIWRDFGKSDQGGDIYAWFTKVEGRTFPEAVEACAHIAGVSLPNGSGHPHANGHAAGRESVSPDRQPDASGSTGNEPIGDARREIEATYDYRDADGSLVFQVVRFLFRLPDGTYQKTKDGKKKKLHLQRRPDGQGGWVWKMEGVRTVPYRLPEALEAIADDRTIFVAEGEKKCDALAALGFSAVCNPAGAGKWPEHFRDFFAGARVIILPDNDEAGRKHTDQVGANLADVAASVMVLDLPDLPPKGDVVDWIAEGGTAAELAELAGTAREWTPAGADAFASKFGAVIWGEPRKGGQPYEYLIKGIVPRFETVLIYGASQSGKSFFTFDLAMAVARGVPFAGRRTRKGLVIYCAAEAGVGFVDLRMPAYGQHHGIPAGRLPFVCLTRKFDLFGNEPELVDLIAEIKHHAAQFDVPLEAVVIDTLNKTTPGMDEISGKDVGVVMKRLERIREECNCGLWLVHHKNAAGTGPRGHTSLYAAFETAIEVSRAMSEKDSDDRPIRFARLAKQREGEDGIVWRFVLPSVEIGRDVEGDAMTSCVVAPPAGQQTIAERPNMALGAARPPSPQQSNILRALLKALSERGEATPPGLGLPRSITTVTRVGHWYDAYRQTAAEQSDDAIKQAMKRASDHWLEKRVIGRNNPYVWITGRPVTGVIKGTEDQPQLRLPEDRDPPADEMVDPLT